jgi:hypothetical protein
MATPAIQTLLTDAQQVLNLNSLSEVRATMAAALANANVGTPLNPNLTTQQLWDEFYLIVRQPESDIESIITNQLMKFLFAPPAPGGAGADQQVIFNDGGVLAGDPQFLWNKTTNLLTVTGSATITGDLTVDTSTLRVNSSTNRVGVNTASPTTTLDVAGTATISGGTSNARRLQFDASGVYLNYIESDGTAGAGYMVFAPGNAECYRIATGGTSTWSVGGSTAMTLNSTGLGVGGSPSSRLDVANSGTPVVFSMTLTGAQRWQQIIDTSVGNWTLRDQTGSKDVLICTAGSGNVGVGVTPSGSYKLEVSGKIGATNAIEITGNNSVSAATGNGQAAHGSSTTLGNVLLGQGSSYDITFLNKSGSVAGYVATGATTITTSSDERIKENLVPITNAISKVSSLRGVIGNFVKDFDPTLARQPFLIAQDVDKVLPEAVVKANPDQWGVNYTQVIPLLVAAIQELTARVEALEA